MLVTELGILMEAKALQPSKVRPSMLVTELGILMEGKELQPWKAYSPMLVTELGILMDTKALQYSKALRPMLVTSHPATRFLISAEVALLSSNPFTVAVLVEVFISYIIPSLVYSSAHEGSVATKHTNRNSHW